MRFDGDSAVMSGSADGGGYYAVDRSVVATAGWEWDGHLEAIRRAEGRHGVDVTETGLSIRWRNPGDYEGRHRRLSDETAR